MGRTIWIMAGEESGDGYGARLAAELLRRSPGLRLRGMGGRAMAAAGVELLVDSSDLGVVGFVEVFRRLGFFLRLLRRMTARAARERPDAVVLIDYPGFNLRFARSLHGLGIAVVYYISPQVWAWKRGRRHRLAAWCRRLLCIFPFEPECFADTPLDVRFVGHPLVSILRDEAQAPVSRDPTLVLLLPGSRQCEVRRLLPVMVRTAAALKQKHPRLHFVVPLPRPSLATLAEDLLKRADLQALDLPIAVDTGRTRTWMRSAGAALAASGTVTMEAAILGLPLVSVYRLAWPTYVLARLCVRDIPYFTIVNLVAGRVVYQEFLQGMVRPDVLAPAVEAILPGGSRHAEVLRGMADTVAALGGGGDASGRAAAEVLDVVAAAEPAAAGGGVAGATGPRTGAPGAVESTPDGPGASASRGR
ncbi:MAG: lipid-A-disaccharide synthase [Lentisphaeria bacterium]|nr:lipid-A-disaccharide synthase [Lentisphaeria bacterium]